MWSIVFRAGFLWNAKKIGQKDNSWKLPDFSGPLMWMIAFGWFWLASVYLRSTIFVHLLTTSNNLDETSDDLNIQVAIMTLDLLTKNHTESFHKTRSYYCLNRGDSLNGDPEKPGYIQAFQNYFHGEQNPPLDVEWEKACESRGWPK